MTSLILYLSAIVASIAQPTTTQNDTLLIFTAKWCPACVEMEQTVWPKVDTSEYKVYKIDADKSASVLSAYGVTTIPTVIKGKESDGKFKEEKRKVGSMNVEETKNFLSGA